jgi:hypothetical protein
MQGSQFANPQQVGLGATPKEGPMAIPFAIDFTVNQTYTMDLTAIQQLARISIIQTLYVDNSLSTVPLTVLCATTQQKLTVAPGSQAYISVVLSNKLALTILSTSGLVIPVIALNIAMNTYQWQSGAPAFNPTTGALIVSDPILEAAVAGSYFQTREYQTAGDGSIIAVYAGTKAVTGLVTTTAAATILTGAPGWILTSINVAALPNSTLAAAGELTATLAESGGSTIAVGDVFLPTAAPTGLTGKVTMINMESVNITSKIATSNLTLTLSAAPATGGVRYYATYAPTNFVGG